MIPALRDRMVQRLQLIDRIEQGLAKGFVLVSAPPGYGKTTLIAEWAHQSQTPTVWLSLDGQDNDLAVINRYLSAFLHNNFPAQQPLLVDLPSPGNPELEFRALLVAVINACSEMAGNITVIVDDYHLIQNPQIHNGLLFLLEHLPCQFRLILITRSDPPFPLARFRANNHICELRAADLVFSVKETTEFLTCTMQLDINESRIGQFFRSSEGWVTGLQLAALSLDDSGELPTAGHPAALNQNLVQRYIIEEVFFRQSAEVQDFLLRTSVLENLSAPLCDALLKNPGSSHQILHYLDRSNLFISALDEEGKWYRYHPLFAEALRHLLKEEHGDEVSLLHARASEWFDQNDMYEEALSHALATNDFTYTANLLNKYIMRTIKHGDFLALLHWIKKIPEELLETSPLLCLVNSWSLILSLDLEIGEKWVNKADRLLEKADFTEIDKGLERDLRGGILAVRSILAAAKGEDEQAIEFSRQALDQLPKENNFSYGFALLDKGMMFSLNGNLSDAVSVLREAIRVSQASGNWMVMMIARCSLGDVLISRGELSQALTLLKKSLAYASPPKSSGTGFEGVILTEIGEIYLLRNQIAEASETLHNSVTLSRDWLPKLYELDAHIHLAHLLHCQGDYKSTQSEFQRAREISEVSEVNLDDLVIDLQEAQYALQRGEIDPVFTWAQKQHLLDEDKTEFTRSLPFSISTSVYLVLSRLLLHLGIREKKPQYFKQAAGLLNTLILQFQEMGYAASQIEAWLLLAITCQESGDAENALKAIQKALALAEPEGFRQVFIDEGLSASRLLIRFLAYQKKNKLSAELPTRNFVADLLFRLTGHESNESQDATETRSHAVAAASELLTPRELEVLRLAAGGRNNQEIALELNLSINTVKRHLNNTFLKLGATSRTQAIALAHQQGWLH